MTGTVVWDATYLPFGGVQTSAGPNLDLRFPGQWFQAEAGLHQNWMRDYDPTLGRYLQADPLGLIDGASIYGYALQNPGRYTDPTGEFVWFAPIIGFAGGAAVHFAFQTITNWWYGMSFEDAYRCVDVSKAFVAGAFAGGGASVGALVKARRFEEAAMAGAVGFQINTFVPTVYVDEPECGCEVPEMPRWVEFLRNLPL